MRGDAMNNRNNTFFLLKCIHMGVTTALFYVFWMLFRYHPATFSSLSNTFIDSLISVIKGVGGCVTGTAGATGVVGGGSAGTVAGTVIASSLLEQHRYDYFITIGYAVLIYLFNRTYNSFLLGFTRIRGLAFAQFMSQVFSVVIVYFAVSIAWTQFKSPHYFFIMLAFQLLFDCLWSLFAGMLYFRLNLQRRD